MRRENLDNITALLRIGDEKSVYQPYPGGQAAEPQQKEPPASLRIAVWFMYGGAALSLIRVIVDLLTEGTTRNALRVTLQNGARSGPALTTSQLNAAITTALALALIISVFSVGVWLFIARASRNGSGWARITGTVLFVVDTLALLVGPAGIGVGGAGSAVAKVFGSIVWVAGLGAVMFLWRKDSTAFFRAQRT